jgi:hypothetical protein
MTSDVRVSGKKAKKISRAGEQVFWRVREDFLEGIGRRVGGESGGTVHQRCR